MATIEIDGKKVEAKDGSMIIQAADAVGAYIPRFCYHKKLSIAANCRMCLVQVGEGKKPMPACATPIMEGMKVYTKSEVALNAQKAVMEFLLINHPLDCPICDQGGQCELQDLSMGFGASESRYDEGKRSVKDKSLGPLIATEMTRCIQCTRCVRFSREIAGAPEIGMVGRGEHSEITTYVEKALTSDVSGNMIDVCPVGALTAKPSRFTARPWELQQRDTIAPHDCLGSNLHIHVRRGQAMKATPRENESINETWLSDRDRFSYQGLNSEARLTQPMIKRNGQWQTVDWTVALEFALEGLQKVLNTHGAEQLGAIISPSATLEEMYLLQKLMRGVGSDNIDHRLHRIDFSDQVQDATTAIAPIKIADLEQLDVCLLVDCNVQKELPLAELRLRKMTKNGGQLLAVTTNAGCHAMRVAHTVLTADIASSLAAIAKALGSTVAVAANTTPSTTEKAIAVALQAGQKVAIILGQQAINHEHAAVIKALSQHIAELAKGQLVLFTDGANTAGAMLTQALPTKGLDTQQMLAASLKGYILFGIEPEMDIANPAQAMKALNAAEFVVSLTAFTSDVMQSYADVLLPIAPFTETSGTFVNIQGDWQSFNAVATPLNETRPGWKVLRVLGNYLKVENFDYTSSVEIRDEVHQHQVAAKAAHYKLPAQLPTVPALQRIGAWGCYRADSIVRHAPALQQFQAQALMNPATAAKYHVAGTKVTVKQGSGEVELPLTLTDNIADGCVFVLSGFAETAMLGASSGAIEVRPC